MVDLTEDTLRKHGRALKGAKIAILGVSYLNNSADIRNTPSEVLYDELVRRGRTKYSAINSARVRLTIHNESQRSSEKC